MSEPYEIINPLKYPGWDELLISSNDSEFFHTSVWAALLSESYRYEPAYFVKFDQGRVCALIPVMEIRSRITGSRGVSLPFTDYSGCMLQGDGLMQEVMESILPEGRRRGWKYYELRGGRCISSAIPKATTYLHHTLGLSRDEESLFKACSENTRRNIRKARNDGVSVNMETSFEAVRQFYRLHCITRKGHGVPPPPFRFFEKFHRYILARGYGIVFLASFNTRVVAAAVYLNFGGRAIYKYGASDPVYQHYRPNHLIMWEAIRYFAANGYRELCFGRTDIDDEGLRRFKNSWGTKEEPLDYYRYDLANGRFLSHVTLRGSGAGHILSKLPVPLLRAAGTLLYRHMG